MAALAPPRCPCQPLFRRAADRRWYCVEISLSGRAPGDGSVVGTALSAATASTNSSTARSASSSSFGDRFQEPLSVAERDDAEFLQIGVGKLGEKSKINIVLRKALRVLSETEPFEPVRRSAICGSPSAISSGEVSRVISCRDRRSPNGAFLRDLLAALEALPDKRLVAGNMERSGDVCAIGALGKARGVDMLGYPLPMQTPMDRRRSPPTTGRIGPAVARP